MPDRVEGLREVDGGKDGPESRLGTVEPIRDGLGEEKNLVHSGATGPETGLKRGGKTLTLNKENEPGEDHLLKELGERADEGDRPIGDRKRGVFP